jgi:hypothetical protein
MRRGRRRRCRRRGRRRRRRKKIMMTVQTSRKIISPSKIGKPLAFAVSDQRKTQNTGQTRNRFRKNLTLTRTC